VQLTHIGGYTSARKSRNYVEQYLYAFAFLSLFKIIEDRIGINSFLTPLIVLGETYRFQKTFLWLCVSTFVLRDPLDVPWETINGAETSSGIVEISKWRHVL